MVVQRSSDPMKTSQTICRSVIGSITLVVILTPCCDPVNAGTPGSNRKPISTHVMFRHFRIYNDFSFQREPDLLKSHGIQPIRRWSENVFWNKGESRDEPIESHVRNVARRSDPRIPVCLNIEHWPVDRDVKTTNESVRKLVQMIRWMKDTKPALKIGFYRLAPVRKYSQALQGPASDSYQKWQAQCVRMKELARHVDIIFPSLYTFYPDQQGWETYAKENINMARMYGKPVVPYLWYRYHVHAKDPQDLKRKIAGKYIGNEYWMRQLKFCHKHADSVVIFDNSKSVWQDNMRWWRVTTHIFKLGAPIRRP